MKRIAVLGGPKVGKTASIWQYAHGQFPPPSPSVTETESKSKSKSKSQTQTQTQTQTPKFIIQENTIQEGDHGYLVLFDVTNRESFTDHAVTWLQTATSFSRQVVLVATKMDLVDVDPAAREIPYPEAVALARLYRVMYIETGAAIHGSARAPYDVLDTIITMLPPPPPASSPSSTSSKCIVC
jgi:GTPase SAR1 family protein